ncbi:hypothetical protein LINPERPRIM_LOCUS37340 [Linum perenne]
MGDSLGRADVLVGDGIVGTIVKLTFPPVEKADRRAEEPSPPHSSGRRDCHRRLLF